ncbi:3'(2'),5'-bisphosphate nucleotidase CysQ [Desulfohalovibrio reitneri]|uniref:3'(2'),5'-bisphosphate nucleotidase CysQ n=1 Tax=Desulfohalovibrio reitneri TaxID=1307759 RepID=UPI0004A74B49|nr:3'(2'),5'-bisphosphate nucleotidase CysQ [Desulfohalovibrio reitneri]
MYDTIVAELTDLAKQAGYEIMRIYREDFSVDYKEDESPLTQADRAANDLIVKRLREVYPGVPILSEEGQHVPFPERQAWPRFFCVDPLDGTKEFVKRNGEFTVNIAMVAKNFPAFGVVYVPDRETMYWGGKDFGSFKQFREMPPQKIQCQTPPPEGPRAVVSRSHPSPDLAAEMEKRGVSERVEAGSAMKFCLVAEGVADLYLRLNPTMEWDTAAGQAVLEGAGGSMTTLDGEPFIYNKESLKNPGFIAQGLTAEM